MRPVRSLVLIVGAAGLLLFLTVRLFSNPPVRKQGPARAMDPGSLKVRSMRLFGYVPTRTGAVKQWALTALNVSISPDQRIFRSTLIRDGRFFQGDRIVAHFTAGSAIFDQNTKNLDLTGPIHVDGVNGVRLACGSLHYTYPTSRMAVAGPLIITTPQSRFTAGQLHADLALDELTFESTPSQPVLFSSRVGPSGEF